MGLVGRDITEWMLLVVHEEDMLNQILLMML